MTKTVIALKDFRGSPNGYDVVEYKAGDVFELEPDVCKRWCKSKFVKQHSVDVADQSGDEPAGDTSGEGTTEQ